ncbi:hypothetical protein LWI29_016340 [Acer saccharum]|uniref:Uncharacterized protein n=1 Tax=Acer saccharum TaxID=4024 RepID=A0AA39VZP9_ACESA|nr:hypothetical protein LWI29_016340 [Acer saccharum]
MPKTQIGRRVGRRRCEATANDDEWRLSSLPFSLCSEREGSDDKQVRHNDEQDCRQRTANGRRTASRTVGDDLSLSLSLRYSLFERSPQKFYGTRNQRDEVPRSFMELEIRRMKSPKVLQNWKLGDKVPESSIELEIRGMRSSKVLRNWKSEGRGPRKFYRIDNQRDEVPESSTELEIRGTKSQGVLRNCKSGG